MMSLDAVTENKSPALLKVDAEGSEREVLEGAPQNASESKPESRAHRRRL